MNSFKMFVLGLMLFVLALEALPVGKFVIISYFVFGQNAYILAAITLRKKRPKLNETTVIVEVVSFTKAMKFWFILTYGG